MPRPPKAPKELTNPEWSEEPVEKGYATPAFDGLKPQWKKFVISYLRTNDKKQAALEAGYDEKYAADRGWTLARRPDIVEAMNEVTRRELRQAEQARALTVMRLMADSNVALEDLTEWDHELGKLVPRKAENIEPSYRRCMGLISLSREGNVVFNNTAQNAARKLLASYMKWDREEAFSAPPITFDFRGLKDAPED